MFALISIFLVVETRNFTSLLEILKHSLHLMRVKLAFAYEFDFLIRNSILQSRGPPKFKQNRCCQNFDGLTVANEALMSNLSRVIVCV
jgi:hypothetical protein